MGPERYIPGRFARIEALPRLKPLAFFRYERDERDRRVEKATCHTRDPIEALLCGSIKQTEIFEGAKPRKLVFRQ